MIIYRDEEVRDEKWADRIRTKVREMSDAERAIVLEELGRIGLERLDESKHLHGNFN